MTDRIIELLHAQYRSGFPAFTGSEATLALPVDDRWITDVMQATTPAGAPIRDLQVRSLAADRFQVAFHIAKMPFLPAMTLTFEVHRQPELPQDPVLVLRLTGPAGVLAMVLPVLLKKDVLPPGVSLEGELLSLNVQTLLEQRGAGDVLRCIKALTLHTREGKFIVSALAGVTE
jgi:hypothetical protein